MRKEWDVVIVGAGPAGVMSALCLVDAGMSILLVDRASFPRYKVCGGCLNLSALESLRTAGQGELLAQLGAPVLQCVRLLAYGEEVQIPLPGGHAVSRATFDAALVQKAIMKGAVFQPSTKARLIENDLDGCVIELRVFRPQRRSLLVRSRVVVGADGIAGDFLPRRSSYVPLVNRNSRIGVGCLLRDVPCEIPAGEIQMTVSRNGYVGAVRVEDGHIDVAAAVDTTAISAHDGSAGEVVSRIIEENGRTDLCEALRNAAWKGTPPLSRKRRLLGSTRLFILGDAAGYVEPFTGEGMAWALMGGRLVAPLVKEAVNEWNPDLAETWLTEYRQRIRPKQLICRASRFVLRHSTPSRLLVSLSRRNPLWVRRTTQSINRPVDRKAPVL